MTKYREILRLASLGLSQQSIADSCGASKKTVNRVLKRAKEINLYWPLDENETDAVIAEKLFPSAPSKISSGKKMPDFDYIQKELFRKGVNKKLLWTEYLEECVCPARRRLCIHSSAIISNRMSRNAALPCTSAASPANRLK